MADQAGALPEITGAEQNEKTPTSPFGRVFVLVLVLWAFIAAVIGFW
jgi:hypothetical protein